MELSAAETLMLGGGIVALPVLAFITTFIFWPGAVIKGYNWYLRLSLGLKVQCSHSGTYRFCYSSRGKPGGATPSLLLLHGFSVNKDMWLPLLKHLPRKQHVVCLDMPGHEGTSRTGVEDYSIQGQVGRIHQFVQSVGLDRRRFHMVGASMGGNVAGVYAAHFPSELSGLTLICPGGLMYPTDTEFIRRLKALEGSEQQESIPLIPGSAQEMDEMLRLCCYVQLNLHPQLLQGVLDNRIPNNNFYREVFMEISGQNSRYSLQENLHLITAPLQVIWGKEDKVLDVSGAGVLQAALPGCQVDLLDHCGHSVAMERPRKAAQLIMGFLSAQEVNSIDAKKLS
ncbi:monoacylglycerol lipase abhd6-A-like [Genypterus blacodes]|uniref:monoacylglycerol lipase abhd6-A-like n=1 Tax=Genypterus blacodes TaxID=154954 RepID=UPI003F75BA74